MALLLKNVHAIDPQVGLNEVCEILIRDGKIVEVGHDLKMEKGVERDLGGKVLVPGLVDMHVHLRDPGQEYKEAPLRARRQRSRHDGSVFADGG